MTVARANDAYRPQMTQSGLAPTYKVTAVDEFGQTSETHIAGEFPLTIYVDKREVVTLMTLGGHPEALTLGYLKNQGLVKHLGDIESVQVDWETESVAVRTHTGTEGWDEKLDKRTVTTGCGQGTVFGDIMEELDQLTLLPTTLQNRPSTAYSTTCARITKSTRAPAQSTGAPFAMARRS